MDLIQAMHERISARHYLDKPIESDICEKLSNLIDECNKEFNLHIQLVTNEPQAFQSFLTHYGKFSNVKNYIVLIGKKSDDLDEKLGYCGGKLVLLAQSLGLNSCFVGLTYKKIKTAFSIEEGEKLCCIIALGYASKVGLPHRQKDISEVSIAKNPPEWFLNGVKAALFAPTSRNQQKFVFKLLDDNVVEAKAKIGFFSKIDLGIAKYHFELGAGIENFKWLHK